MSAGFLLFLQVDGGLSREVLLGSVKQDFAALLACHSHPHTHSIYVVALDARHDVLGLESHQGDSAEKPSAAGLNETKCLLYSARLRTRNLTHLFPRKKDFLVEAAAVNPEIVRAQQHFPQDGLNIFMSFNSILQNV